MLPSHLDNGDGRSLRRDHLRVGIARLRRLPSFARVEGSVHELRPVQVGAFVDFITFLERAAHGGETFGRLILPPRTGKTVIAGQIMGSTRFHSLILEPTKALVEQTVRELRQQLPDVPIGVYYQDEKQLVDNGVNVMTYQSLVWLWKEGRLPECVRRSVLVLSDEGHHTMTELRMKVLREAFEALTIHIALTASANYSAQRRLEYFFPYRIHEVSLKEAVQLGLIASFQKALVHEVGIDASRIRILNGDYDESELGTMLSKAPFLECIRALRYDGAEERKRAGLVACATRQQARDVWRYLCKHRPKDAPEPGLMVHGTSHKQRRRIIEQFANGTIDTIVQVGILIEGWNAPNCKLLIDAAPSVSEVRSLQKTFRPLTVWRGVDAILHMILPENLVRYPLLPDTLLIKESAIGVGRPALLSSREKGGVLPHFLDETNLDEIMSVPVRTRTVMEVKLAKLIRLDLDSDGVREVLASVPRFSPEHPPTLEEFRRLSFKHVLFRGTGTQLLRYLKVPLTTFDYESWLTKLYLTRVPNEFLCDQHFRAEQDSCTDDAMVMQEIAVRRHGPPDRRAMGWRTLFGEDSFDVPSFIEQFHRLEIEVYLRDAMDVLNSMERQILTWRLDLDDEGRERTLKEVGERYNYSVEGIRRIEQNALCKLVTCLNRLKVERHNL